MNERIIIEKLTVLFASMQHSQLCCEILDVEEDESVRSYSLRNLTEFTFEINCEIENIAIKIMSNRRVMMIWRISEEKYEEHCEWIAIDGKKFIAYKIKKQRDDFNFYVTIICKRSQTYEREQLEQSLKTQNFYQRIAKQNYYNLEKNCLSKLFQKSQPIPERKQTNRLSIYHNSRSSFKENKFRKSAIPLKYVKNKQNIDQEKQKMDKGRVYRFSSNSHSRKSKISYNSQYSRFYSEENQDLHDSLLSKRKMLNDFKPRPSEGIELIKRNGFIKSFISNSQHQNNLKNNFMSKKIPKNQRKLDEVLKKKRFKMRKTLNPLKLNEL